MAKVGRPRKARARKAIGRGRKSFAKRRAQARAKGIKPMGNLKPKGIAKGVVALGVTNHFTQSYMDRVPAHYRLPAKMWIAGMGSDFVMDGGNADLKSAGIKLAGLAFLRSTAPSLLSGILPGRSSNGNSRNGTGNGYYS
jgi:hypothetical protein